MSILIKGMELPKEGFIEALIHSDGTVLQTGQSNRINGIDYYSPYIGESPAKCKAIDLPPHGRLIDGDALWNKAFQNWGTEYDPWVMALFMDAISSAPTIIPAEEAKDA